MPIGVVGERGRVDHGPRQDRVGHRLRRKPWFHQLDRRRRYLEDESLDHAQGHVLVSHCRRN